MTKFYYFVSGLFLFLLIASCEKNENDQIESNIESIQYGTSFGECIGYCRNEIKIKSTEIDFRKNGWNEKGVLPEVSNTKHIDHRYWSELISKINLKSFKELTPVIGCPDCADGGAEWVEIKTKETSYKVIFEYQNEPSATQEYIGDLRTYLNTFQSDSN